MPKVDEWFNSWLSYLVACWDLPMHAPTCVPLWYWVMVGAFLFGALVFTWIVWKVIGDVVRMRRLRKMMAEREANTAAEIERVKWRGDEAYEGAVPPEKVEQAIRDGLEQRRLK